MSADSPSQNLTGLSGWVAGVIESLGEVGVGLLVALENIIPPIPSEVVLALAGYLANQAASTWFWSGSRPRSARWAVRSRSTGSAAASARSA